MQFSRKGRGACSSSPAPSPQAGDGSTENPTHPPNVHYALGTPILSQRGNSSRKTGNLPAELPYSAGFLTFSSYTSILYTENFVGIDGKGGCFAGFIDTDILRIVPRPACTVGGATYQGKNFVCPASQIGMDQGNDFGVLLGWDYMNESIV